MVGEDDDTGDIHVERVRVEMERRGWSQRMLADKSLTGESTIFRLLRGQYSRKTLVKVQTALGLDAPLTATARAAIAAADLGGYARDLYEHYEGDYRLVRETFEPSDDVMVYPLSIEWSDQEPGLVFEDGNPGYEQRGCLLVPSGTPLIHLTTYDRGSARLITAYHMPPGRRFIRGLVLTIANPRGRELYPAVAPVVMHKLGADDPANDAVVGRTPKTHPLLSDAVAALAEMTFDAALLRG